MPALLYVMPFALTGMQSCLRSFTLAARASLRLLQLMNPSVARSNRPFSSLAVALGVARLRSCHTYAWFDDSSVYVLISHTLWATELNWVYVVLFHAQRQHRRFDSNGIVHNSGRFDAHTSFPVSIAYPLNIWEPIAWVRV